MKIGRLELTLHEKERKKTIYEQVNNLRNKIENTYYNVEVNAKAIDMLDAKIQKIEQNIELMSRILNKMQNGNK